MRILKEYVPQAPAFTPFSLKLVIESDEDLEALKHLTGCWGRACSNVGPTADLASKLWTEVSKHA